MNSALKHMQAAESKVGRTAEIVCRLAICWSFFDKSKSQQLIKEALKLNPNHPRLNYIIGLDAKQAGDFELAIKHYLKAIKYYPVSDIFHLNETYNNLGSTYYEMGNYLEAKQAWEQALVFLPKDRMTRDNLREFIYENPEVPKRIREISPFIQKYWVR
ncbi:tetratricopeptide repeat protein [bacterium]|nr:tetratricopeptide repeat protein [bacterium]MBU1918492.1 tetratricopeptide repeat protein [bacterium]